MSLSHAEALARALPKLVLAAERLASGMSAGAHPKRRPGPSDSFWQFRPFTSGDETRHIDWRRSARAGAMMVREREAEAAATLCLHLHDTLGLNFTSHPKHPTKRDRAFLLLLASAILLLRAGERLTLAGHQAIFSGPAALPKLALALATPGTTHPSRAIRHLHFGDFLSPDPHLPGIPGGAIIQILDPAEQNFPYRGRIIFTGFSNEPPHEAAAAEAWSATYQARLTAHLAHVKQTAEAAGQTYILHNTAADPATALAAIHQALA